MDAVPALTLSLIALFPGLMLYCAIYDVFCRRNNVVSTVPRDPKSVEALAVIILGALAVHLIALILSQAVMWPCVLNLCKAMRPVAVQPGEAVLIDMALGKHFIDANDIYALAATTLVLGLLTYWGTDQSMRRRATRENLPYWLYRWTSTVAISADRATAVMLAYVLTTIEVGTKRVMYVGLVDDLALDDKFDIQRIVLVECDRFLFDLSASRAAAFGSSLGNTPKLVLQADDIANVSLERVDLPTVVTA